MRRALTTVCIVLLLVVAGCSGSQEGLSTASSADYGPSGDGGAGASAEDSVGVAVGGAQDANAFRSNVEEGHVPPPSSLTYEGLYHDYYFDTGQQGECEQRFCPSYSEAVTRDPVSNETEQFMTVGLNSGLSEADFQREKLNLIVVVDVSGSMSSPFDEYYYDDDGERQSVEHNEPKMDVASDAIATMSENLGEGDRIGVVSYEDHAETVRPLQAVGETDMDALRGDLHDLRAGGGTNLDAGMRTANEMASDAPTGENRSTRVVYVTDAMPNLGDTSGSNLEQRLDEQAEDGVYTTFVGVGVDFNAELTETISTVEGANYYAVHSPSQFEERMDDGFAYMVTPLAHDLSLEVESEAYEIEHVYGSPQADESTGELIHVNTLFPSRSNANGSEGSVMLVELEPTGDEGTDGTVTLNASYRDPGGEYHESTRTVTFADREGPYFENSGVRKAVVLTEYATLMRNWMVHERAGGDAIEVAAEESVERRELGTWEQTSVDLQVTDPYDARVERFDAYFRRHAEALGEEQFEQDLAVLDRLLAHSDGTATPDGTQADEDAATREETAIGG